MKRLYPILAALLLTCACMNESFVTPFVENMEEVCMVQRSRTVFTYNPSTCQMAFNRERCEFRVHTDNMSDFYTLTLSRIPSEAGQKVTGTLVWTDDNEVNARKNVTFTAEKLEGDRIWLWTDNGQIGVVVRILDQ